MEFFSAFWLPALLAIILIALVLADDKAVVLALAARYLPPLFTEKGRCLGSCGRHRRSIGDDGRRCAAARDSWPDAGRWSRPSLDRLQTAGGPK